MDTANYTYAIATQAENFLDSRRDEIRSTAGTMPLVRTMFWKNGFLGDSSCRIGSSHRLRRPGGFLSRGIAKVQPDEIRSRFLLPG